MTTLQTDRVRLAQTACDAAWTAARTCYERYQAAHDACDLLCSTCPAHDTCDDGCDAWERMTAAMRDTGAACDAAQEAHRRLALRLGELRRQEVQHDQAT